MKNKKNLTHSGSTGAPAYAALKRLGYTVYREINFEQGFAVYFAENDELRLSSMHLEALLGLHLVWEMKRDGNWHETPEEKEEYMEAFPLIDWDKNQIIERHINDGDS